MKKLLQNTKYFRSFAQTVIVVLAGVMTLIFVGAGCMQDVVTPAYVDKGAAEWADVPTRIFLPYTSLWDAKRVAYAIDYKLTIEKIKGGYYKNITNISILAGEEFKGVVFNPNGLLSLLMVGGPMCALGAYGISKPKDKKEIEELKNGNRNETV